jgi:hypothetical protein
MLHFGDQVAEMKNSFTFCDRLHINAIKFMQAFVLLCSLHMKKPTKKPMRFCLTAKGLRRIGLSLTFFVLYCSFCFSQETNSNALGRVYSDANEKIAGVTITVIHAPTQNTYISATGDDGYFHFFNLKPGGPYSIILSSAGYQTLVKHNLFLHLGIEKFLFNDAEVVEYFLQKKTMLLDDVVIKATNGKSKTGIETSISNVALQSIPSVSRNFQDFLRLVPQAKVTAEGSISLAGQNNRFNAFFIDGANNNDISGIAVSGMNGGQTGSPPISMDAIEEINVLLAPYDPQYGNFTGGSINAITRSGSNDTKSSAWYYFRNQNLAGRSPTPLDKPGAPGQFFRPRLSQFLNQTFGIWNSGALIKNKLFYFALIERQSEVKPQPYNMSEYRGNSNQEQLQSLYDFVKSNYQYDAGTFLETKDELEATRMNVKLDWNVSVKDKFMMSYRFNRAERNFHPRPGSNTSIVFANSGVTIPATTHSLTFEWKHFLNDHKNNRLLLTFTDQADERKRLGQPFPSIMIADGNGSIELGSEPNTGISKFNAQDFTLFNVFTWLMKRQIFTAGTDINYTIHARDLVVNYFGGYQFQSVNHFLDGNPFRHTRGFYLLDNHEKVGIFKLLKSAFFLSDKINISSNFSLSAGVRLEMNAILLRPEKDNFFNDSAASIISTYYSLDEAMTGRVMKPQWNASPRISAEYLIKSAKVTLKGGAGIFSGHTLNAWTNEVFNSFVGNIDINPELYGLGFNPNPYDQPTPQSLNVDPSNFRGFLYLQAKHFKYPSVFRSSFAVAKKWNGWLFSIEAIFTKNVNEVVFRNVNITPPNKISAPPDARNVYSTGPTPPKITLRDSGLIKNPYSGIYLLTNNKNKKGDARSLTFIVQKQAGNFSANASYTYGSSRLLFEVTGAQTLIASQWRNMETVHGRNYTGLSTSDNDLGHRITAWLSQKISYRRNKITTSISVFYNGQSGSSYSYVYNRSMINDNGVIGENFDLIYIPTVNDLTAMNFAPITSNGQTTYSAEQQKDLLNSFIESDKYLRSHRGEFAERNGARLPFTHIIDLKLQQDFNVKIGNKNMRFSVSYDVFNFTNLLNRNWGRIYFLNNDSYPLITFAGWTSPTSLIPQYQFKPFNGKPYSLQTSSLPGNSARWISQLGIKINLD